MGYCLGKCEGIGSDWHGHVTAVTVAPSHRKLGIATELMKHIEQVSDQYNTPIIQSLFNCVVIYRGKMFYVDLFVRESNKSALEMYRKMGYTVYRRILDYYSGFRNEDGLDLRKSLSMDPQRLAMIPLSHPVHASNLDY